MFLRLAAALVAAGLVVLGPGGAVAQQTGPTQRPPDPDGRSTDIAKPEFYPAPPDGRRGDLARETTDLIVRDLSDAGQTCARLLPKEFVVDCLAIELDRIARKMPRGEYERAKTVIGEAAEDLRRLARANADPSQPRKRLRRDGQLSPRTIIPVQPAAADRVNAQAALILQEAETRLLRSAESSERRMVHYRRIAAAVGSSKVLLRSL